MAKKYIALSKGYKSGVKRGAFPMVVSFKGVRRLEKGIASDKFVGMDIYELGKRRKPVVSKRKKR